MLKTALAIFIMGGVIAWGQTPKEAVSPAGKVDRAAAYYHFMLAHMYSEMAAASGDRSHEYAKKASENFKAAIKADPNVPILTEERSKGFGRRLASPKAR
jgi:hypothetical protein